MRISDWSSDVCSSDLQHNRQFSDHRLQVIGELIDVPADVSEVALLVIQRQPLVKVAGRDGPGQRRDLGRHCRLAPALCRLFSQMRPPALPFAACALRSEERRVGKECVSRCRYRWSASPYNKNQDETQVYTLTRSREIETHYTSHV